MMQTDLRPKTNPNSEMTRLIDIVARLRGPDGCPWDKAQSHHSLVQYAIEEAFELAEAIETKNSSAVAEELGDFLFQVILHCQIAQETGAFDLHDVLKILNDKMVERHPHVFAAQDKNPEKPIEEIWLKWEQVKTEEQKRKGEKKSLINYPLAMPALQAAQKIGIKTEGYKFDWKNINDTILHLESEIAELKKALADKDPKEIEHEVGDLLFCSAQVARHANVEPEQALRAGNRRFVKRFEKMMAICGLNKEQFRALPDDEKESLWQQAKRSLA